MAGRHKHGKEVWGVLPQFRNYEISNYGRFRNIHSGKILTTGTYGDAFLWSRGKLHRVNPTRAALSVFGDMSFW